MKLNDVSNTIWNSTIKSVRSSPWGSTYTFFRITPTQNIWYSAHDNLNSIRNSLYRVCSVPVRNFIENLYEIKYHDTEN